MREKPGHWINNVPQFEHVIDKEQHSFPEARILSPFWTAPVRFPALNRLGQAFDAAEKCKNGAVEREARCAPLDAAPRVP
jgi:hypothetical protein